MKYYVDIVHSDLSDLGVQTSIFECPHKDLDTIIAYAKATMFSNFFSEDYNSLGYRVRNTSKKVIWKDVCFDEIKESFYV